MVHRAVATIKAVPGQKHKRPYYIRLKSGAPFAFAGLWTPPHLAPPTCTTITTTSNELCAPIHNRMPVLLDPDDEALWFDRGPIAPEKVLRSLCPFPSERMETARVSSLVSSDERKDAPGTSPQPMPSPPTPQPDDKPPIRVPLQSTSERQPESRFARQCSQFQRFKSPYTEAAHD
jgi:hypothetical protein